MPAGRRLQCHLFATIEKQQHYESRKWAAQTYYTRSVSLTLASWLQVRFVMHAWTAPVLAALAVMAFAAHHVGKPGVEAAAMGHWAGGFCAIVMLSVPGAAPTLCELNNFFCRLLSS